MNDRPIFLIGGGTAGSVTPLLAVAEHLPNAKIYFVGTKHGVERQLVPTAMPYLVVPAGKWRRYFSLQNLIDPFKISAAFFKSLYLLLRYRPQAVVSAGSFVATPVIWAAWCCGIPIVVHQQDLPISLTTKLTKPFANVLTKIFQDTPLQGAQWIGNPVRNLTPTTRTIRTTRTFPTVLVFGGGTGAQGINDLVTEELCQFSNVIHITGKHKVQHTFQHQRYHRFELLQEEYKEALHQATVVVARAGLGTISELAVLGKPAIIIPMPNSHQEYNAEFLQKHNAAIILDQTKLTPALFIQAVQALLKDKAQQKELGENIKKIMKPDAAAVLANNILAIKKNC